MSLRHLRDLFFIHGEGRDSPQLRPIFAPATKGTGTAHPHIEDQVFAELKLAGIRELKQGLAPFHDHQPIPDMH
ncbi:hypothetical protein [uncultured Thiodictyon sp.]|uniref:hypothetical protein n=1 Tax=uncultured Thiodictyon sp. TaxID=1846217 RepID=UPI0025DDAAF3|nr:hypothetical protein [uncultured Thiodictyon sp.]